MDLASNENGSKREIDQKSNPSGSQSGNRSKAMYINQISEEESKAL